MDPGLVFPCYLKGDLSDPQGYRGIALTPIAAKIYNRLLLNRTRPQIDPLLRGTQNGYRKGRSTQSHVLTLRRVIEGIRSKNLQAVLTFVDFRKAFDSVIGLKFFSSSHHMVYPIRLSMLSLLCI